MSFAHSETPELVMAMQGAVLRRGRESAGRTLADVAEAAGISQTHLSEVERGRKEMSTEKLINVARTLGLPLASIYRELADGLDSGSHAQLLAVAGDPEKQLRYVAAVLEPAALRAVADFSSYLLLRQTVPQRKKIGFEVPRS